jgi:hypothetical protein
MSTLVHEGQPAARTPAPRRPALFRRLARRTLRAAGWLGRWLVGAALCLNTFTSILVVGWTYRWLQGLVLRGWWKKSRLARDGTFDDFCAGLGPGAPVPRPRWFLRERVGSYLGRPGPGGRPAGRLRRALRLLTVPWYALWLNLKTGVAGVFCTYLLTGPGCVMMYFGWEYGWLNSFNKGYEQPLSGLFISLLGIALFTLSMVYVPMAQVHQAVTGEARAFFDFRFVWRLVRARPAAHCGLALLTGLAALPLAVLKSLPFAPNFFGNDPSLSDAEVLERFQWYLFGCCLLLFPTLLLVRRAAARLYRAAVLKVLRRGDVTRAELHPVLARWLDRLGMMPVPLASRAGLGRVVVGSGRWVYRLALYLLLVLLWLPFTAQSYVGEFFLRHQDEGVTRPTGFLNHPLIQLPAFDFVPRRLRESAAGEPPPAP